MADIVLREEDGWFEMPGWLFYRMKEGGRWGIWENWPENLPHISEILFGAGVLDAETGGPIDLERYFMMKTPGFDAEPDDTKQYVHVSRNGRVEKARGGDQRRLWIKARKPFVVVE